MISNPEKDAYAQRMLDRGAWTVDAAGGVVLSRRTGAPLGYRREYVEIAVRIPGTLRIAQVMAHRVIWLAVHGPFSDPALEVNHINGVKVDNRIGNLELVTGAANTEHAFATGLIPPQRVGVASPRASLTPEALSEVRALLVAGLPQSQIAARVGVSQRTVSNVKLGRRYPAAQMEREATV